MNIDMNNAVSATTYANEHDMIEANVIQEIREGNLEGQVYRGQWFVTGVAPSHPDSKADKAQKAYIQAHEKSSGLAVLLAVIIGPLGVLYGSLVGGVILTGIGIGAAISMPPLLFVVWVAGLFVAPAGVGSHNQKIAATAALMSEGQA